MLAFLKRNTVSLLYQKRYWRARTLTGRWISNKWKQRATLAKGAASKHFNRDLAHLCWFRLHRSSSLGSTFYQMESWQEVMLEIADTETTRAYFPPIICLDMSQRTPNRKAIFKFDFVPNILAMCPGLVEIH